jgi:hypothetical protein
MSTLVVVMPGGRKRLEQMPRATPRNMPTTSVGMAPDMTFGEGS